MTVNHFSSEASPSCQRTISLSMTELTFPKLSIHSPFHRQNHCLRSYPSWQIVQHLIWRIWGCLWGQPEGCCLSACSLLSVILSPLRLALTRGYLCLLICFSRDVCQGKSLHTNTAVPQLGCSLTGSVNCWKRHGEKGWHSQAGQAAFLLTARITADVISVDGNIICLHFLETKIGRNAVALQIRTLGLRILLSVCVVPGTVGACPSL